MRVEIDEHSGFCFGVVRAIDKAEEALSTGRRVYSLGDIVHNRVEMQRLEDLGLSCVTHRDVPSLSGEVLFVRAHGEPPSTFVLAAECGVEVVDATCPVVARLQKKVTEAHEAMAKCDGQVVILGKRGHAEVVGLTGQVADDTIVVESEAEVTAENIDFGRPIYFLSQTTQSIDLFKNISAKLLAESRNPQDVTIDDTICRQVSNRGPHLTLFASMFDVVLFVCGKKSSNGKVLFEVCKAANPLTYNIEDESELRPEWFEGVTSVGICGATSTPKWLMERVKCWLERQSNVVGAHQNGCAER